MVEVRPARPWSDSTDPAPFRALRARFRAILDAVDRGEIPAGVAWDGVPGAVRRASGGRAFAEWRLDELGGTDDQPDASGAPAATSSATRSGRNRSA